ncbi:MAG: YaeQ family protein [Betaproteobacteria bacterium]|jgi:uncharacterized protein YaeQ|nr:YaeQ family protein [Betaproteobacteria bacterium]
MALKATIFKATLAVADIGRGYYGTHALTLARHPSETDERMMARLLAFALHADPNLAFGRGLSTDDEPALALADATGAIATWIDVGLPDERALRRAAGRARGVVVYAYGGRAVDLWWARAGEALRRLPRLSVHAIAPASLAALAALVERTMDFTCTIEDGHVFLSGRHATVAVELSTLHASGGGARNA